MTKIIIKNKKKLHRFLKKIHLVDKFLIVIMFILMFEIVFNLFHNNSEDTNTIDVIIRTSAAAIFGYFISANFIRSSSKPETNIQHSKPENIQSSHTSESNSNIQNKIGFTTETNSEPLNIPETPIFNSNTGNTAHLQIIIVGTMGIIALLALLIFRNFCIQAPNSASAVSQLRDFVSGSVGFLIGCTTGSSSNDVD